MESAASGSGVAGKVFWCGFYSTGIIASLVVYGILQERIMTIRYGSELFGISVFLVFCNRVAAVVFATCMVVAKRETFANSAPIWKYLTVSLSNVYASTCQYEALKYVSFPVQQLGKSFKMMPVMLWGIAISGKQYTGLDWLIAAGVTGGVTEFLLTGPLSSPEGGGSSVKGLLFLLAFLALDGLTSTMQEKLFKEHKTSKYNQMLYINSCSAVVSLITLLSSSSLLPALHFCRHGFFVLDTFCLSVSAVAGQWFIYSQVKEFGALVFAATMNVRQVVSIIISFIRFHHPITGLQVIGLLCVFSALFYKSYCGFVSEKASSPEKAPLQPKKDGDLEYASNSPAAQDADLSQKKL